NVEIQPGAVPEEPFTQSVFPAIKGTGGGTVWGHKLAYLSDTRDDTVTPTIGYYLSMFAELAQTLTASTNTVFSRYGIEYKTLIPNATKQYTFVFRARLEATVGGDEVPFFERSSVGGQNTFRAFGAGRFGDNHSLADNSEERIQLFHCRTCGTRAAGDTAPCLRI